MNPHQVTKDFERALFEYTGAPYAVTTTSCTMALLLAVAYHIEIRKSLGANVEVEIPKRTYVGVPYAIREAGGIVKFRDEDWIGAYQLKPLPIWDSARWFTSGMYNQTGDMDRIRRYGAVPPGAMICVSFHWGKTLGIQQGGAILLDDHAAADWLRRARFDGRTAGVPPMLDTNWPQRAWHAYMSPEVAAEGVMRLSLLPKTNAPLPNDDYPDLSEIFK